MLLISGLCCPLQQFCRKAGVHVTKTSGSPSGERRVEEKGCVVISIPAVPVIRQNQTSWSFSVSASCWLSEGSEWGHRFGGCSPTCLTDSKAPGERKAPGHVWSIKKPYLALCLYFFTCLGKSYVLKNEQNLNRASLWFAKEKKNVEDITRYIKTMSASNAGREQSGRSEGKLITPCAKMFGKEVFRISNWFWIREYFHTHNEIFYELDSSLDITFIYISYTCYRPRWWVFYLIL